MVLANSINLPGAKSNVTVQYINPTHQPLALTADPTIGTFTSIDQQDITECGLKQPGLKDGLQQRLKFQTTWRLCFKKACRDGVIKEQASGLAELLNWYQATFSQNDQDVEKTDLVQHSIPVPEKNCLIKQPPSAWTSKGTRGGMLDTEPVGQRND